MKPPDKLTLAELRRMHNAREPIVMATAYSAPTGRIADEAGVELVLVGDSAAVTCLGYDSTTAVSIEEMLMLSAAVTRSVNRGIVIGDLPFGSYEVSNEQAVATAQRFIKEARCDAIKLEGGHEMAASRVRAIVQAGIPVIGHLGLLPQTAAIHNGFRAVGRNTDQVGKLLSESVALSKAGCFALVFEAVPAEVTKYVVNRMDIPTIGIGAGRATSGQVLVFDDLVGLDTGHTPRFVRRFGDANRELSTAMAGYVAAVRDGSFPADEHTYPITDPALAELLKQSD